MSASVGRAGVVTRRFAPSLVALAALNLFLADASDGLGPFLDAFLATHGWSPQALGAMATAGGILGLAVTPAMGALVDATPYKRALVAIPVVVVTAAAIGILSVPNVAVVIGGQTVTVVIAAVIGPAVMGLTLGLVGAARFPDQVSRNQVWNHGGNVASLIGVYLGVSLFGVTGVVLLMLATAIGALVALALIDPAQIDHQVARGLVDQPAAPDGPPASALSVVRGTPGLLLLAVILAVFHFGNAPLSRLLAQQFSVQLGTPFRTTAIITGVSQVTMIAAAVLAPWLIRRFGLAPVFIVALCALPLRGAIAAGLHGFAMIYPAQILDGVGAGLIGIVTPVAVERLLAGTGRFNVGLAAVMTVQGIGASTSNVLAGWLTGVGGYSLAYGVHGGLAIIALTLFVGWRHTIVVSPD
ncbi:MAG: MFS transporter [Mycobacterium sp.]